MKKIDKRHRKKCSKIRLKATLNWITTRIQKNESFCSIPQIHCGSKLVDSSAFSNKIRSNIEHTFARPVSCFDRFPPEIKTHRHKVVVAAAAAAVKWKWKWTQWRLRSLSCSKQRNWNLPEEENKTEQNFTHPTTFLHWQNKKLSKKNVVEVLASAVEHQILVFSKWILGVLGPS